MKIIHIDSQNSLSLYDEVGSEPASWSTEIIPVESRLRKNPRNKAKAVSVEMLTSKVAG